MAGYQDEEKPWKPPKHLANPVDVLELRHSASLKVGTMIKSVAFNPDLSQLLTYDVEGGLVLWQVGRYKLKELNGLQLPSGDEVYQLFYIREKNVFLAYTNKNNEGSSSLVFYAQNLGRKAVLETSAYNTGFHEGSAMHERRQELATVTNMGKKSILRIWSTRFVPNAVCCVFW